MSVDTDEAVGFVEASVQDLGAVVPELVLFRGRSVDPGFRIAAGVGEVLPGLPTQPQIGDEGEDLSVDRRRVAASWSVGAEEDAQVGSGQEGDVGDVGKEASRVPRHGVAWQQEESTGLTETVSTKCYVTGREYGTYRIATGR